MEGKSKHAHHGFTHSHHEHHADGSITVHHVHHEGPHKDVKHAVSDLDGAHDSMQDHLGVPNDGEDLDEKNEKLEEAIAPGIHQKMAELQGK